MEEVSTFSTYGLEPEVAIQYWSSDFTLPYRGRCYTLNYTKTLGTHKHMDALRFEIPLLTSRNTAYDIWIHDSNFFVFSLNTLVIPHIARSLRAGLALQVAVTEHKKIDQPWKDNPCNSDPAYSFNKCVKNSLSKIIDCRVKYDSSTAVDVPACSTVEQVFQFGSLWANISTSEKREIEALTGCLGPCFYRSYEVIGGCTF